MGKRNRATLVEGTSAGGSEHSALLNGSFFDEDQYHAGSATVIFPSSKKQHDKTSSAFSRSNKSSGLANGSSKKGRHQGKGEAAPTASPVVEPSPSRTSWDGSAKKSRKFSLGAGSQAGNNEGQGLLGKQKQRPHVRAGEMNGISQDEEEFGDAKEDDEELAQTTVEQSGESSDGNEEASSDSDNDDEEEEEEDEGEEKNSGVDFAGGSRSMLESTEALRTSGQSQRRSQQTEGQMGLNAPSGESSSSSGSSSDSEEPEEDSANESSGSTSLDRGGKVKAEVSMGVSTGSASQNAMARILWPGKDQGLLKRPVSENLSTLTTGSLAGKKKRNKTALPTTMESGDAQSRTGGASDEVTPRRSLLSDIFQQQEQRKSEAVFTAPPSEAGPLVDDKALLEGVRSVVESATGASSGLTGSLLAEVLCDLADFTHALATKVSNRTGFSWTPKALQALREEDRVAGATEKRKKTAKRVKDPNQPRRPLSSYNLWCEHIRRKVKEEDPDKCLRLTELAEMWKVLPAAQKTAWDQRAKERKDDYQQQMEAYRAASAAAAVNVPHS